MTLLVIGATGLLGAAVAREAAGRGTKVVSAARSGASLALDIGDRDALAVAIEDALPDAIVNCAALSDIAACEADPELADRINARPVAVLAEWSRRTGHPLVHISTDHFFTGGGASPHREEAPVDLVNTYARSKHAGEALAAGAPAALVLRASPVGLRGWAKATLAEWAIAGIEHGDQLILYEDAFTSSLDSGAAARAILDLIDRRAAGLLNLGSSEVYSKADLIRALARHLGRELNQPQSGSVSDLVPRRAACLGLEVGRAEDRLGYRLPGLNSVVAAIVNQYRDGAQP